MTDLITKSSEEIMTTLYKPTVFVVDGLFAQGLYLLAGSPKVGKSWLALELCLAVAKGEKLFDRKTLQGSALYFCLEDSYQRIQNRLYELTDDPSDKAKGESTEEFDGVIASKVRFPLYVYPETMKTVDMIYK